MQQLGRTPLSVATRPSAVRAQLTLSEMRRRRLLLHHLDVVWSGKAHSIAVPQDASLVTHAAKVRNACVALGEDHG